MQKVTKAVIPAAGLGTRMYPFTKEQPKLMVPLLTKPVIEYLLEELTASGIKEVIIVSNHVTELQKLFKHDDKLSELLKKMKKDTALEEIKHLESLTDIELIRQDAPMGWMHEILHAEQHLDGEPFLVCFSDVLFLSKVPASKQLIDLFYKTGKNINASTRYIFKPYVLDILRNVKFDIGNDHNAISGVFGKVIDNNDFFNCNIEGTMCDLGDKLDYLKAQTLFGLNDPEIGKRYRRFLDSLC